MKRAKRPVIVYERKGTDGLITFYHHITIHGNRERVRLESLGRHRGRQAGGGLLGVVPVWEDVGVGGACKKSTPGVKFESGFRITVLAWKW